jgi:hypothetical protein
MKSAKPSPLTSPTAATEAPSAELGFCEVRKVRPSNWNPGVPLIGLVWRAWPSAERSPIRWFGARLPKSIVWELTWVDPKTRKVRPPPPLPRVGAWVLRTTVGEPTTKSSKPSPLVSPTSATENPVPPLFVRPVSRTPNGPGEPGVVPPAMLARSMASNCRASSLSVSGRKAPRRRGPDGRES